MSPIHATGFTRTARVRSMAYQIMAASSQPWNRRPSFLLYSFLTPANFRHLPCARKPIWWPPEYKGTCVHSVSLVLHICIECVVVYHGRLIVVAGG